MADEVVTEGDEPTTTTTDSAPPAAQPAAPPAQVAPWTSDLEQYISDPAARAEADRYMREKVQPRITQLEDSPAQRLYRDLVDETKQDVTVAAVVGQIYGEEYAQKFVALFGEEGEGLEEGQTIEEGVQEAAGKPDENAEWVAQKRAEEKEVADQREYDAFMDRVVGDEGNAEWRTLLNDADFTLTADDKPLLAPFMAGSETVGEAVTKYADYVKKFAAKHGHTPAQAAGEQAAPPATLGDAGAPASTPPTQTKYTSWDQLTEAVQEYQAEQRSKAPPATL